MKLNLSLSTRILLAGLQMEEREQLSFTQEELIVEVWKMFPEAMGLKGFEKEYPDSHKVLAVLAGKKGLVRQGYLSPKEGVKFSLNPKGREIAYDVAEACNLPLGKKLRPPIPDNGLPKNDSIFLSKILSGEIWFQYKSGELEKATLTDAARFWGLPNNKILIYPEVKENLDNFERILEELKTVLTVTRGELCLFCGRHVGWDDVLSLQKIHRALRKKFNPILELLRKREANDKALEQAREQAGPVRPE